MPKRRGKGGLSESDYPLAKNSPGSYGMDAIGARAHSSSPLPSLTVRAVAQGVACSGLRSLDKRDRLDVLPLAINWWADKRSSGPTKMGKGMQYPVFSGMAS